MGPSKQVFNESERLNGAQTAVVTRTRMTDFANVDAIMELLLAERVSSFTSQFQLTLVDALVGAKYGKNPMESLASYEGVPDSETYTPAFRGHVRMAQMAKADRSPTRRIKRRLQLS